MHGLLKYRGTRGHSEDERNKIIERQAEGNITAVEFTKLLGYKSRNTTYKKIRQYEEDYNLNF